MARGNRDYSGVNQVLATVLVILTIAVALYSYVSFFGHRWRWLKHKLLSNKVIYCIDNNELTLDEISDEIIRRFEQVESIAPRKLERSLDKCIGHGWVETSISDYTFVRNTKKQSVSGVKFFLTTQGKKEFKKITTSK